MTRMAYHCAGTPTPNAPAAESSSAQVTPASPDDQGMPTPTAEEEPPAKEIELPAEQPQPPQQPNSIPDNYGDPPKLSPEECARCRYIRVVYGKEADFDEAKLCAHEPSRPMKPLNRRGAHFRYKVKKCNPDCCVYYSE